MKYVISLLFIGAGVLMVWKTLAVQGIFGRIGWAERNLGGAGSVALYKLIGLAAIIFGLMLATGAFGLIGGGFLKGVFGGFGAKQF
jgi:hypothetical protein